MAKSDVELVIKARDSASKFIDAVKDSLKDLVKAQADTGSSAAKTDSLLTKFGKTIGELSKQASALDKLGKAASHIDKMGSSVARMESDLAKTTERLGELDRAASSTSTNIARVTREIDAQNIALEAQRKKTQAAADARSVYDRKVRAAERTVNQLSSGSLGPTTDPKIVDRLTAAQKRLAEAKAAAVEPNSAYKSQADAQKVVETSLAALRKELRAYEDDLRRVQAESATATVRQQNLSSGLGKARSELHDLSTEAKGAASALKIVSASQEAVSQAAARNSAQLAQTKARLEMVSQVRSSGSTDDNVRRRQVLEAKRTWVEQQEEVKRLTIAMKDVVAPTDEMGAALGVAQGKARALKDEYLRLRDALAAAKPAMDQFAIATNALRATDQAAQERRSTVVARRSLTMDYGGQTSIQGQIADLKKQAETAISSMTKLRSDLENSLKLATSTGDKSGATSMTRELTRLDAVIAQTKSTAQSAKGELTAIRDTLNTGAPSAQRYADAVAHANAVLGAAKTQLSGLPTAYTQTAQSATRAAQGSSSFAQSLTNLPPAADRAAKSGRDVGDAFESVYGKSRQAMSVFQRLRGELLSLTTSYVGLYAAINQTGQAIDAYKAREAAQSRLGVVFGGDQKQVAAELAFLEKEAMRLGMNFGNLAQEYGKYAIAAKEAKFSTEDIRRSFITVAEAGRVNKLSTEQMSGVFLALTQMMSKGKVTSEELRRQLGDRMAGAFQMFAQAIGVSAAELDEMMKKGEVFADRTTLLSFIEKLGEKTAPQLSNALNTLTTDLGRFENNVFRSRLRSADAFAPGLRKGLQELDNWFNSNQGQQTFDALGNAAGGFISLLAKIPQNISAIATGLAVIAGVKLGQVFAGIAASVAGGVRGMAMYSTALTAVVNGNGLTSATFNALGGNMSRVNGIFIRTIALLTEYRAAALAAASGSGIAAAGARGFAVALTGLQALVTGTANLVRGLWMAFGGLPGILATIGTVALTSWLTSTNDATESLKQHEKVLDDVVEKYRTAKDVTGDWAKEVAGASTQQLKARIAEIAATLDDIRGGVKAPVDAFGIDTKGTVSKLKDAIEAFKSGKTSALEFKKAVNDIAEADPTLNRTIVVQLLETADNAKLAEDKIKKFSDALALVEGKATDAQKANLGLNETFNESVGALARAETALRKYNAAIETLKEKVPALAAELKYMKEFAEIDASGLTAFAEAVKGGDFSKIAEVLNLYGQARGNIDTRQQDEMLKAWGLGGSVTSGMLEFIKKQEGYRDKAYQETISGKTDVPTIGYGTIKYADGRPVQMGDTITQTQALRELALEVEKYSKFIDDAVKVDMTAAMKEALVSYAYNVGPNSDAFKGVIDKINKLDFAGAQASIRGGVATIQGAQSSSLAERRAREATLFGSQGLAPAGILVDRQKALDVTQKTNESIAALIEQEKRYAAAVKLSSQEKYVQQQIEEANKKALQDKNREVKNGIALTDQEVAAIRKVAVERYNAEHPEDADKPLQDMLTKLQAYSREENALRQRMELFKKTGNTAAYEETARQLEQLKQKILEVIPAAEAMLRAMGNTEGADKLRASLESLVTTNEKAKATTSQLNDIIANNLTQAIDTSAKAVGEAIVGTKSWGEAWMTVKNAAIQMVADTLREIAMENLKPMIKQFVNNLTNGIAQGFSDSQGGSMFGGIFKFILGLFNFGGGANGPPMSIAPTAHSGGVVGSRSVGYGNRTTRVSPLVFAGAQRYHSGGLAGLKPGEVPTILQKNEEVLTTDNPRHIFNAGQQSTSGGNVNVRQVLAFSDADIANAMSGASGEKVILTALKRNASTVRQYF